MTDHELSSSEVLSRDEWQIFISYRETEEKLAVELQRLLEKVLEPTPRVFVASAGGLRPSRIGWREQIGQALHEAKVFIGIITKNSKDREWIFFEAGAAWGRKQLYAPFLVDLSTGELPSSISAYQSTFAFDKQSVRKFVDAIAEEIKLTVKNTFSKNFNAFSKYAETYKEKELRPDEEATVASDEKYPQVVGLLKQGKQSEAVGMINELSSSISSPEELVDLKLLPIIHSDADSSVLLSELDNFDQKLKQTKQYLFWAAFLESSISPHRSLDYWNEYLRFPLSEAESLYPTCECIRLHYQLGRTEEALTHLRAALKNKNRRLKSQAAQLYVNLCPDHPPHSKLLVLTSALSSGDKALYQLGLDLSLNAKWDELALLFADLYHSEEDTANSSHELARALHQFELPSLAFQAYQRGIEAGSLVSAASAANLLAHQPVAAAGQSLLNNLATAENDALNPNFPHSVRANLESKIIEEQKKLSVHTIRARIALNQIIELAEFAVNSATQFEIDTGQIYTNREGIAFQLQLIEESDADFSLVLHSERGRLRHKFKAIPPFPGIYQREYSTGFFIATGPNALRGVELNSSLSSPPVEIIEYVGREKSRVEAK